MENYGMFFVTGLERTHALNSVLKLSQTNLWACPERTHPACVPQFCSVLCFNVLVVIAFFFCVISITTLMRMSFSYP